MAKYPIADNEIGYVNSFCNEGVWFSLSEVYKNKNSLILTYKEFREQYPFECGHTNHRSRNPSIYYNFKKRKY